MSEEKKVFPPPAKAGAKCKKCRGTIEGSSYVKIAKSKWHKDCAKEAGKKIPIEYENVQNA